MTTANPPKQCTSCGCTYTGPTRRGHCRPCYDRRRHAGTLPDPAPRPEPRPCARCGIHTTATQRVCRDCRAVLDHNELERWAS